MCVLNGESVMKLKCAALTQTTSDWTAEMCSCALERRSINNSCPASCDAIEIPTIDLGGEASLKFWAQKPFSRGLFIHHGASTMSSTPSTKSKTAGGGGSPGPGQQDDANDEESEESSSSSSGSDSDATLTPHASDDEEDLEVMRAT